MCHFRSLCRDYSSLHTLDHGELGFSGDDFGGELSWIMSSFTAQKLDYLTLAGDNP
jgi:hypothetical protein